MFKLVVFVPETHKEQVKAAMFSAGAGEIGLYDQCSFESKGTGQFRPKPGSNPFLGKTLEVEKVDEYRIEMVCKKEKMKAVILSLRASHPYEEPAFDVIELNSEWMNFRD
jgi:hypothetical protein